MSDRNLLLVAYVDGELDPAQVREAERLIATDPQARATVAMFRETADLLRAACHEDIYKRDVAILPAASRPVARPRQAHGLAIAASLAMAIIGFGGGTIWAGSTPATERAELLDEVAGYHAIYSRETRHLVEVPAEQTEHLKAWLGQRLARNLEVPDLAAAGLRFAGGRMVIVNGRPVAQLMYTRDHGLPVGVCLTQMPGSASAISIEQRGSLQLAEWEDGRYGYVVVGEMDGGAVREIAERVKSQLKV